MAGSNLINIEEVFELAFGISKSSFKYKVGFDTETMGTINFGNIPTADPSQVHKMSWMGTPIMFPVKFEGGVYNKFNKGVVVNKTMGDHWLPPTTLVDFRRARRITKTPVNGNNGTVKELISFDDWQIRFRIICLDSKQVTAQEELNKLIEWFNLVSAINVIGDLFFQKDIFSIVLTEIDIKQVQGNSTAIPVEITALSDSHFLHQEKR